MREMLKMAAVLALITVCSASALSNVYLLTRDKIAFVEAAREAEARQVAMPTAGWFERDSSGTFVFYRAYDDSVSRNQVGFVVPAEGQGYSSVIRTMVGVDNSMTLTGIKVAFQQETPGLGTRVEEVRRGETFPWFQDQFKGKTPEQLLVVRVPDPNHIESITGATITSDAIASSVRAAIERLRQDVGKP